MRSMAGVGQLAVRMRRDDVLYCALPLYHNNALTVSWSAMLGAGCTLALGRKFSATRFWDEIHRVDATAFCYIGELRSEEHTSELQSLMRNSYAVFCLKKKKKPKKRYR